VPKPVCRLHGPYLVTSITHLRMEKSSFRKRLGLWSLDGGQDRAVREMAGFSAGGEGFDRIVGVLF